MNVWVLDRAGLQNDLLEIFAALDDLQYQYDWVITDHEMWYSEACPENVKRRWQWTGLLIDGREMTRDLSEGYVRFVSGGILSAVPRGTKREDVCGFMPTWQVDCASPDYAFQTPFTKLEIICCDGYAWEIVCKPAFSPTVRRLLPEAKPPEAFQTAQNAASAG